MSHMEHEDYGKGGFKGNVHNIYLWRKSFGQRGWMRPMILNALETGPKNGIEIMESIQEMGHGWMRPTPGFIYPLLEQLAKENVIRKNDENKYELGEAYKKENAQESGTGEVLTTIESNLSYLEELAESNKKEFAAIRDRIAKISERVSRLK
jgi:DNA-binding PadR family transcriptional regulator